MRHLFWLAILAGGVALAQDRPELNGVWQLDPAHSALSEMRVKSGTLSIKQDDDSIKIADTAVEDNGKERKSEYECNTNGKECAVKLNGQAVKLSAYYNGAILVTIEQRRGPDVIKTRWKTSEDGNTLTLEIANLARPGSKPETAIYTKQVTASK